MKNFQTIALVALMFLLFGCSQKNKNTPAQVRWGQFLMGDEGAHVSLSRKGKEIYTADLDYATLTDYQMYPPAIYQVSVKIDGQEVLNKEIGLGSGGTYTLNIYGMPLKNQKTDQRSTAEQLHRIVEGAAAETANAYLPKLDVMNDYFASGKQESKIRVVHLAPGVAPIKTVIYEAGKKQVSFSNIKYPKIADDKSLKTGEAEVTTGLSSSDQVLNRTTIDAQPEKLYTLFVIPNKKEYLNHLMVIKGTTPKKH